MKKKYVAPQLEEQKVEIEDVIASSTISFEKNDLRDKFASWPFERL